MSRFLKRFTRQVQAPNGDVVSLNEHCNVSIIPGRAVVIKQGVRMIGYFDAWPEQDTLEYIRAEFVRIIRDPATAPDPDWSGIAE